MYDGFMSSSSGKSNSMEKEDRHTWQSLPIAKILVVNFIQRGDVSLQGT
jgi:ABC-type Zn uptake system ZnuABC Zn-binding protein ZnuA